MRGVSDSVRRIVEAGNGRVNDASLHSRQSDGTPGKEGKAARTVVTDRLSASITGRGSMDRPAEAAFKCVESSHVESETRLDKRPPE